MFKDLLVYAQYLLPQHALSQLIGLLANSRLPWIKNAFIKQFIKKYRVSLQDAVIENPEEYDTFNAFFIRKLKQAARPIDANPESIISPVDGSITQMGTIYQGQLLQAKNNYFDLQTLLGGSKEMAELFREGQFATLYLAPNQYHRIHMPYDGVLSQTIYVPGKLFSVNLATTRLIPEIYNRNERLICLFETAMGPMAVILVGALIVGCMQTVWMDQPIRANKTLIEQYHNHPAQLKKGEELGYFKVGSTVIVLFGKDRVQWGADLMQGGSLLMGQGMGYNKS